MTVPNSGGSAQRSRDLALQATLEWLEHPNFKTRVSGQIFMESVTVGRTFIDLAKRTSHNDFDPAYKAAKQRWHEMLDEAKHLGWLIVDVKTTGRPRTKEYSPHDIANARRRLRFHRPAYLETRDERVTDGGQKTTTSVVTIQDHIWRDLLNDITAEALVGNTRAEIIEALGLPERAAVCFWRWLNHNGWKQKRVRHADGSRSYVLAQREVQ